MDICTDPLIKTMYSKSPLCIAPVCLSIKISPCQHLLWSSGLFLLVTCLFIFQLKLCVDKTGCDPENSGFQKWIQWLRFVCFPKLVQWCNEKLSPPSLNSISIKLVSLEKYQAQHSQILTEKLKYCDWNVMATIIETIIIHTSYSYWRDFKQLILLAN